MQISHCLITSGSRLCVWSMAERKRYAKMMCIWSCYFSINTVLTFLLGFVYSILKGFHYLNNSFCPYCMQGLNIRGTFVLALLRNAWRSIFLFCWQVMALGFLVLCVFLLFCLGCRTRIGWYGGRCSKLHCLEVSGTGSIQMGHGISEGNRRKSGTWLRLWKN